MNDLKQNIVDFSNNLKERIVNSKTSELEKVFLMWLLKEKNPLDVDSKKIKDETIRNFTGSGKSYISVAILGFIAETSGVPGEELTKAMNWMIKRPAFSHGSLSFEQHPVALLGFALAIKNLTGQEKEISKNWLKSFLNKSFNLNLEPLEKNLISLAALILDIAETAPLSDKNDFYSCVKIIAIDKKIIEESVDRKDRDSARKDIFSVSSKDEFNLNVIKFATIDCLFKIINSIDLGQSSINDVIRILEGIPHGLRRWTWETEPRTKKSNIAKWEIENEYHVQSLLWFLLAPIFPDIEDEKHMESIGIKNPRADLCIPSLKLIIEVKFLENGHMTSSRTKLTDSLAQDNTLYLVARDKFDKIITVIWDDSSSTEFHKEIHQSIEKGMDNIVKSIIISRPGKMS